MSKVKVIFLDISSEGIDIQTCKRWQFIEYGLRENNMQHVHGQIRSFKVNIRVATLDLISRLIG